MRHLVVAARSLRAGSHCNPARFPAQVRLASMSTTTPTAASTTPMEDVIRAKITASLSPTLFEIRNDSHLHSHHKAMAGVTSRETHFALNIVSASFASKPQPARHRMVYSLLKPELEREGGIHALQLRTKTPEEEARGREKEGNVTT